MRSRRGLSFTMTLVVVGVVLLMTSLAVIIGGGGSLGDWGQRTEEHRLGAVVGHACAGLGQQIDRDYCNGYVNMDADNPCADVRRRRNAEYDTTAQVAGCDWLKQARENNPGGIAGLLTEQDGTLQPLVTVQGSQYNCVSGGAMTRACPAGRVSAWTGPGSGEIVEVSEEEAPNGPGGTSGDNDGEEPSDGEEEVDSQIECPRTDDGVCEGLDFGSGSVGCPAC